MKVECWEENAFGLLAPVGHQISTESFLQPTGFGIGIPLCEIAIILNSLLLVFSIKPIG